MKWLNKTEERLTGGHHNSFGRTVSVAETVLEDSSQKLMNELCECYKSEDDVVRMRVSSALKRISGLHSESISTTAKPRPEWIIERFDWLVDDIGYNLDQPSAKWSIAQIMMELDDKLTGGQRAKVVDLLKHNLEAENDWIVMSFTAEALTKIAIEQEDSALKKWLKPRLKAMSEDERKSVASKGKRFHAQLN